MAAEGGRTSLATENTEDADKGVGADPCFPCPPWLKPLKAQLSPSAPGVRAFRVFRVFRGEISLNPSQRSRA
jgi:hypothetical protein